MLRATCSVLAGLAFASGASASTLSQTVHFPGADVSELVELYLSAAGQEKITGLPARFVGADGSAVDAPGPGDRLLAFCFEPDRCGLDAQILAVQNVPGQHTVVMSWWNFGWVSAIDPTDYVVDGRGAPDSVLVLTFRDTPGGAQIELVQANVPDYKVRIPNPDGSEETGPLSAIVNTHWNTLYWDGVRRLVAE